MRLLFLLCFLVFAHLNIVIAQDTISTPAPPPDNLNRLLREREQIIKEYEYYKSQNSNFWGKKSKKDLLNIVDVLKAIINKDSEIIREINQVNLKKRVEIAAAKIQIENEKKRLESQVMDDKRVVTDNIYDLKAQIQSLQNLQKVKQKQLNEAQETLNENKANQQELQQLLAIAAVVLIALVIYLVNLQRRLSRRKA